MQENIDTVQLFRDTMANYPTGVSVVTAIDKEKNPFGITVNSFASVSLDPLLILWSIDHNASTYDQFMETEQFVVNILAEEQADVASTFARSDIDRFAQCEWDTSEADLPIITGALASLQCNVFQKVEAGDHIIFIGEIFDIQVEGKEPLLYHNRKLGALPASFHED
ncbi:MAG TPA: flavin reductase family protein [Pseudogracilibacillus sp.]|nr:flavin reductase family protein [Pseudogracilibacillus sp.]